MWDFMELELLFALQAPTSPSLTFLLALPLLRHSLCYLTVVTVSTPHTLSSALPCRAVGLEFHQ